MLESLFVVGGSVLTLFLLMSVGFLFGRMGLLSGDTLSQVSRILLYVVTPCIMLTSFEVERTAENQAQLLAALAAMAGLYVAYMLLSQVLFPRAGEAHQGIMRFAAVYGNAGFMGLPLIQSVMGDEAMMVAVVGLGIFNAVSWTQGRALIGGRKELSGALIQCLAYGGVCVVEQYIAGREIQVGILEDRALPSIEIVPKEGFYDYENKYQPGAAEDICPAPIPAEWERRLGEAALTVFHALGLSVYSRADFIVTEDGTPWFLEINTLPGMTPASLLPKEAAAAGLSYHQLCQRILELSLDKSLT